MKSAAITLTCQTGADKNCVSSAFKLFDPSNDASANRTGVSVYLKLVKCTRAKSYCYNNAKNVLCLCIFSMS